MMEAEGSKAANFRTAQPKSWASASQMQPTSRHRAGLLFIHLGVYVGRQWPYGEFMWAQSVVELAVASDYGAMFVYDVEDFVNRHLDQLAPDGGEDVMTRAMDDGTASRRFVGYDDGFVVILPPSQYNFDAPLRVEVGEGPPPDD